MKWLDNWGKRYREKHNIADDSPYSNLDFFIDEITYPIRLPFRCIKYIWHFWIYRDMF